MSEPTVLPSQDPASDRDTHPDSGKLHDQTKYLTGKPLALAVFALNAANGVAFMDLMGISALLPTIATQMHAERTIAWANTSQLIAATVGQCILGYLSDVYSRKTMLLFALGILAFGSLASGMCNFANLAPLFFVTRAIRGIGTGSISNLVNITQNDFLPLARRGTFQGFQGLSVSLGSMLGTLLGATLAVTSGGRGWSWLY